MRALQNLIRASGPAHAHLSLLLGLAVFAAGCRSPEPKTGGDGVDLTTGDGATGSNEGHATKAVGTPSGPPVVNYPGFDVLPDGRSVVTVQVRGPVSVTEQKSEGRLVFVLAGVAVPERVNRLPLVTQHFPTQVTAVTVEQSVGGANLLIDLREASSATFKVTQNEAGNLLTVTLPRSERWSKTRNPGDDRTNFERPTDVVDQSSEEGAPKDYEKETERRRKRSKRQPKPYVMRPITLPHMTLAPDISVTANGYGGRQQKVFLASGVRWGIIDQVEVELTPHEFRLYPNPAYAFPSLGITAGYTGHVFEIAGRARYFIGVDSDNGVSAGALLVGAPMAIHLSKWGRIDTGAFATFDFENTVDAAPADPSVPHGSGGHNGLVNTGASPFYVDPGIPFYFLFQPVPEFWFGIHHGISIFDFNDTGNSFALPLGAELGISATNDFNPIADLGLKIDLPRLITPGRNDPFDEQAYEFAVWFRWYYHL